MLDLSEVVVRIKGEHKGLRIMQSLDFLYSTDETFGFCIWGIGEHLFYIKNYYKEMCVFLSVC
jgi:hypothetical protein